MRFYLIGAGVIGRTHADAIRKLPNQDEIQIKVADPNPEALAGFAERFPEAVTYADAKEMLAEAPMEEDVVIVGAPPFTHYSLSVLALQSGRHVLCEKPLVMTSEEAVNLLECAKRNNRMFACCSVRFIGSPKMEEVRRIIRSGELGDIYKVTFVHRGQRSRPGVEYQPESKWFLERAKSGGGIVMDWGPYDFSVLNDLFAPTAVEVVAAWTSKPQTQADPVDVIYDVEGHVGAMLKYALGSESGESGKTIWVQYERASCTHGEAYHHCEIEGTMGAVKWSPYFESDQLLLKTDSKGEIVAKEMILPNKSEFGFMDHPVYYLYQKIKGLNSQAIINEQAVFNFQCLQAIYECAESGTPKNIQAGQHQLSV